MAKDQAKPRVRITDQFRTGQAMTYDLSCEEVRLTLQIKYIGETEALGEWNVAAHARQTPEERTIDGRGKTKREALSAVADAWRANGGTPEFPTLDWEAVTQALLAVRAV